MRTRGSLIVFMGASLAVHAAFVSALSVSEGGPASAGPPPALVAQGNSFEDLVEGTPDAEPPTDEPLETDTAMQESAPPPVAQATPAEALPPPDPLEQTEAPDPAAINAVQPALQLQPDEIAEADAVLPATIARPDPEPVEAEPTDTAASTVPVPEVSEVRPPEIAPVTVAAPEPARIEPVTAPTADRIEALPDVQVQEITASTRRPPNRPADLGKAPPPRTERAQRQPAQRQPARTQRGNSNRNAQRGHESGTGRTGEVAQAGQGGQAAAAQAQAGRQAAANYRSAVMRKISRTRRERVRSRGVATVGFSVAASGGLASLSILRSSGDATLDQVALNHIRRAAPFPPPPPGATRSFSIEFRGR